jgi:hemerythrin-like domain-containing protein
MSTDDTRRHLLQTSLAAASAAFLEPSSSAAQKSEKSKSKKGDKEEQEVTASEDLMREHGVLRRALLVYAESSVRLRQNSASVDPTAVQKAAQLFRDFGEEYHEKKLEETYIFPAVRKLNGNAAKYPDILLAQHRRGREITDYILAVTKVAKLGQSNAEPLAKAMDGLVRMYQNHAAREDTIVFPAWKKTMTQKQLDEIGEKFEDIEHQQFGKDGFEDAEKRITVIEGMLGLTDLSQFTAQPPPRL